MLVTAIHPDAVNGVTAKILQIFMRSYGKRHGLQNLAFAGNPELHMIFQPFLKLLQSSARIGSSQSKQVEKTAHTFTRVALFLQEGPQIQNQIRFFW